jgi:hypothetical protein
VVNLRSVKDVHIANDSKSVIQARILTMNPADIKKTESKLDQLRKLEPPTSARRKIKLQKPKPEQAL